MSERKVAKMWYKAQSSMMNNYPKVGLYAVTNLYR